MRALFDVSMFLALFDSVHSHHPRANAWWDEHYADGWASCPLTQNGFVRILSQPGYPRAMALADAISTLRTQVALPSHQFWPDDVSIADPTIFDHRRILGPNQITDVDLLALAVKNGGRLVTFDRAVPIGAVRGAQRQNVVVL